MHDAVDIGGDRGDDRNTVCRNEIQTIAGIDVLDVADQADVGVDTVDADTAPHRGEQLGVLTGDADGVRAVRVDQSDQFTADLTEEHHPGDVENLGCGHPEATLEIACDTEAFEHRADLRATAVHDDGVDAAVAQEHHVGGEGGFEQCRRSWRCRRI